MAGVVSQRTVLDSKTSQPLQTDTDTVKLDVSKLRFPKLERTLHLSPYDINYIQKLCTDMKSPTILYKWWRITAFSDKLMFCIVRPTLKSYDFFYVSSSDDLSPYFKMTCITRVDGRFKVMPVAAAIIRVILLQSSS